MAVAFAQGKTVANNTASTSVVGSLDTPTRVGSVLIAVIGTGGTNSNSVTTAPAGWTLLVGPIQTIATNYTSWVYWKNVTAAESSWTWTMAQSNKATITISEMTGATTDTPLFGHVEAGANQASWGQSTVTTVVNGAFVLGSVLSVTATAGKITYTNAANTTVASQGGTTAASNDISIISFYDTVNQAVAGATTSRTTTTGSTVTNNTHVFNVTLAPAGVVVQSVTQKYQSASASIVIAKPAGTVSGDLLLGFIANANGSIWNAPAGWTKLGNSDEMLIWKIAGGSEPATYTFTNNSAVSANMAQMVRITGHDPTTPVGVFGQYHITAGLTTVTLPTITQTRRSTLVQQIVHYGTGGAYAWTPPAGTTEVFDANDPGGQGGGATGFDEMYAGASGTRVWTATGTGSFAGQIVQVNPATVGPVVESFATTTAAGSTSIVVTAPSGLTTDDIVLVLVDCNVISGAWTPPDGTWVLVGTASGTAAVYRKTAGASEPATYTFTRTGLNGANAAQAIRVSRWGSVGSTAGLTTRGAVGASITLASQTVTDANSLFVQFSTFFTAGVTWTPPGGTIEDSDTANGFVGHDSVAAGTTGTRVWTPSANPNGSGAALVFGPIIPPSGGTLNRSATLYLQNSPTVDTGTGIDVRALASANGATNDVSQSVRFTHTQDNIERTFDPANTLDTTVADATALQKKGWALTLADVTPSDDTNCNAILAAGTLTVSVDVNLNMNGGTVVGGATTQTFRASLWRYNISADTGTLIASGSQTQAWTTSVGGDNNTYKTVAISVAVGTAVELLQGETLLLQLGVRSGTLPDATLGTTNYDITLRIDNAVSRIAFAASQGIRVLCLFTGSPIGEGLSSRGILDGAITRTQLGEGLVSSTKIANVLKTLDVIGEGLVSRQFAVAWTKDAVGEGLTSMTRVVVAAKSFSVVGEGLVTRDALLILLARSPVGEGLISMTRVVIAAKSLDVVGEGLVSSTKATAASRTFTVIGEGLVSRSALLIAMARDAVGEGLVTSTKGTTAVKTLDVVGEGLASRGALVATLDRSAVGEGLISELHPVNAMRTFTLTGKGELLMTGPNGSSICIPLDEVPTGGGGTTTVLHPIFIFDD